LVGMWSDTRLPLSGQGLPSPKEEHPIYGCRSYSETLLFSRSASNVINMAMGKKNDRQFIATETKMFYIGDDLVYAPPCPWINQNELSQVDKIDVAIPLIRDFWSSHNKYIFYDFIVVSLPYPLLIPSFKLL
jgi:hypothetical protein